MRARVLFLLMAIAQAAPAALHGTVVGDVRVQALSTTLVRLEVRGPHGFEDRKTFHVVDRDWPGLHLDQSKTADGTVLNSGVYKIVVPDPTSLKGVKVTDKAGATLYEFKGDLSNSVWLPAPGSMPTSWAFADSPRVVPSKFGLAPALNLNSNDPLAATSGWDTGNDAPDVYVFLPDKKYMQLRQDFVKLTGPVEMPPLFMLGYIDSRYFAYHEEDALARIQEYRRRGIPLDAFVVDTDWRLGGSHGYSPDPQYFPDMPRFLKAAHDWHVKVMFNDHPEPASKDALDPAELKRRADGLGGLLNQGVDVWWYDRNWPVGLVPPAPNLAKEVWGMKLYHDITLATKPNLRPVIMANVDGIDNGERLRPPDVAAHRYPVQWTGDTLAHWEYLRNGVENAVFEGVQGLNGWVNEDLGGHVGKPSSDLYIRYLQYGSVAPVMRVHCTKGQTREPWAFGPDAEKIVPEYIKMRYRLLPMQYADAREGYETGMPMIRRLDLFYPDYPEAARNDQFILGESVLVAPIVASDDDKAVPAGLFHTPDGQPGLHAEYFDNQDLQGAPKVTRTDASIDFDWHYGQPSPEIPADHWSARWTGKVGPIPGDKPYHLSITGDDGVRVWIDGKLVVDQWKDQDTVVTALPNALEPGKTYDIKVEYFDDMYGAVCRLHYSAGEKSLISTRNVWIPPGTWTNLWTGEAIKGPGIHSVTATLDQMPMFVKAGAIVPLGPEMEYTGEKPWDVITLDGYAGGDAGTLFYEDDGSSNAYVKNKFLETAIEFETQQPQGTPQLRVHVHIDKAVGAYDGALKARAWIVRIHLPTTAHVNSVSVDGKAIQDWKLIPQDLTVAMPFMESGAARDGNIVEVKLPTASVGEEREVLVDATNSH